MDIIITGASRGIGKFLLEKFVANGDNVYGSYHHTSPEGSLSDHFTMVDISDFEQVKQWTQKVLKSTEQIVLINCAGINYNAVAHKAEVEKWKNVININLFGTFNMISNVLPLMREKGFGRIINFSSIVAQKGIPGTSAYAASKSALWGMTKSIAAENAKKGITINTLNLGYFDIGMITEVPGEILASIKKTIPSEQLGNPVNIYNAIKFLIDSDYVNGTSVDINAGLY